MWASYDVVFCNFSFVFCLVLGYSSAPLTKTLTADTWLKNGKFPANLPFNSNCYYRGVNPKNQLYYAKAIPDTSTMSVFRYHKGFVVVFGWDMRPVGGQQINVSCVRFHSQKWCLGEEEWITPFKLLAFGQLKWTDFVCMCCFIIWQN